MIFHLVCIQFLQTYHINSHPTNLLLSLLLTTNYHNNPNSFLNLPYFPLLLHYYYHNIGVLYPISALLITTPLPSLLQKTNTHPNYLIIYLVSQLTKILQMVIYIWYVSLCSEVYSYNIPLLSVRESLPDVIRRPINTERAYLCFSLKSLP